MATIFTPNDVILLSARLINNVYWCLIFWGSPIAPCRDILHCWYCCHLGQSLPNLANLLCSGKNILDHQFYSRLISIDCLHNKISFKVSHFVLLRLRHPWAPIKFFPKWIISKFGQFVLLRYEHPSSLIWLSPKYWHIITQINCFQV